MNTNTIDHIGLMKTHEFVKESVTLLASTILKIDTRLVMSSSVSSIDLKDDLQECKDIVLKLSESISDEYLKGVK